LISLYTKENGTVIESMFDLTTF